MDCVELVPVSLFSQRLSEGWLMIEGYPLAPGDYAVLMTPPIHPRFQPKSNMEAARLSGKMTKSRHEREVA